MSCEPEFFPILTNLVKGDTTPLEATLGEDITDWKIRCEIYDDKGQSIKLATDNTGGSDDQIEVTDAPEGEFLIKIPKDSTNDFSDKGFIEIQVETDDIPSQKYTIHQGEITFIDKKIEWTTP